MNAGDKLFVTEISRLSRNLTEIMNILGQLLEKGVILYSTKDHFVFDDSINSKVLCFAFGLVAEIERNLIALRTKEALALRKQLGVKLGRPIGSSKKFTKFLDNRIDIIQMRNDGYTYDEICKRYDMSRTTLYRYLKRNKIEK